MTDVSTMRSMLSGFERVELTEIVVVEPDAEHNENACVDLAGSARGED